MDRDSGCTDDATKSRYVLRKESQTTLRWTALRYSQRTLTSGAGIRSHDHFIFLLVGSPGRRHVAFLRVGIPDAGGCSPAVREFVFHGSCRVIRISVRKLLSVHADQDSASDRIPIPAMTIPDGVISKRSTELLVGIWLLADSVRRCCKRYAQHKCRRRDTGDYGRNTDSSKTCHSGLQEMRENGEQERTQCGRREE